MDWVGEYIALEPTQGRINSWYIIIKGESDSKSTYPFNSAISAPSIAIVSTTLEISFRAFKLIIIFLKKEKEKILAVGDHLHSPEKNLLLNPKIIPV